MDHLSFALAMVAFILVLDESKKRKELEKRIEELEIQLKNSSTE